MNNTRTHSLANEQISAIELDLLRAILQQLQVPQFTAIDHFFKAGGTSRQALAILEYIQQAYGVELNFLTLFRYPTATKLAHILYGHTHITEKPTLFPIRTSPEARKTLAFVGTRGFVFLDYLALAAEIHPDIEVVYMDWKNLDRDHFLQPQVDTFAQQYHELLADYCGNKPLFLAGICDGSLIAVETSARFEQGNRPPVIILDTRAHAPERNQWAYYRLRLRLFLAHPWHIKWKKIRKHLRLLRDKLSYSSPKPRMKEKGQRSWIGGLPMRLVPTDLYLIRGKESEIEMEADPSLGWSSLTQGKFSTRWVPGTHDTLFKEINVEAVAREISHIIM